MTTTLNLMLPVRLPGDTGVKALLFNGPSPEHHRALSLLGFTQFGYSDERLGRVATLDEAIAVNTEHKNSFWQQKTINEVVSDTVIGDLFMHVRAYVPGATGARMVGRARAVHGTTIERIGDDWAVWAVVKVEVQ